MILLTVGTTFFMPLVLPLSYRVCRPSPWSIARPLVVFILTPWRSECCCRAWRRSSPLLISPALAKLGNVSAVVLIALLVVLYFNDLLGVVGSGALAVGAVFIAGLGLRDTCSEDPGRRYGESSDSGPGRAM